jgi:myosin heavy subunit
MLLRISLIIAILAGLAVGTLNIIKVKEKITTLYSERDSERQQKETAQSELAQTKKDLDKTTADLKLTKQTLDTTTEERDRAQADLAATTKRADKLTEDLKKTTAERDTAQQELAAYEVTGVKPEQIISMRNSFKTLQDNLDAMIAENKVLGNNIKKLKNELAIYKTPEYIVPLPPNLRGKVLVADPKWNFVVVNIGEDQGVLEHGELLVNRDGRLVAKVKIRSVQKDRAIANVLPGWQLGDVLEGDQVIPAHPAS